MEKEYIDMGLPSGTLWASENEDGYFTFDEAVEKFGDNLPAKWQFCELIDNCKCRFDEEKEALVCKSRINGNIVEFPACGFLYEDGEKIGVGKGSYYWSRTLYSNPGDAWNLDFYRANVVINYVSRSYGQAVRCCELNR